MSEDLGKAVLVLDADLGRLERQLKVANRSTDDSQKHFDALAEVARLAERALKDVNMTVGQGVESDRIADRIEGSTGRVGRAAMEAGRHLERVKLDESNAAETQAAADEIDHSLNNVTHNARQAERALARVQLAAARNPGRGVGPFGSGYGRVGLLGAAIGAGTILGPAAGPGALGLLAAIPTLAGGAGGALGTLVLAFQGVGKAIGGDKKAFDALTASQQQFVLTVRSLHGWLQRLKQTAGSSLFPGLTGGLQAALSPGTLGAITRAVQQFGSAIGQAGLMWGRYFGSAQFQQIFGPLMSAGARTFLVLSRAALSLFDALGVLGRAAIPFTNWLADSAAKGAAWLDRFIRAKEATGGLSRALTEAQSSLRLVARLAVALWHAVFALGKALYPVSKVAVKALTDGLNGLAGILHRNQGAIRNVMGLLLSGFVSAVKTAVAGVKLFNTGLQHIVGSKASVITTITLIGLALAAALGPEAAAVAGVLLAVGLITNKWDQFKQFFAGLMTSLQGIAKVGIGGMLMTFAVLASAAAKVLGWIPGIGGAIKHSLNGVSGFVHDLISSGTADIKAGGSQMAGAVEDAVHGGSGWGGFRGKVLAAAASAVTNSTHRQATLTAAGSSPFGAVPAFTKNLGPKVTTGPVSQGLIPSEISGSFPWLFLPPAASGSTSFHQTGKNLLSQRARLAIDRAKSTPGTADDLKALTGARDSLIAMAKAAKDWLKEPIADEIAKLSTSINNLKGSFDGFNLTLAEQKRRSLDARYADKYHGRAGTEMAGAAGPAVTYAPTFNSTDEQAMQRKARRDLFVFRNTVLAG